MDYIFGLLVAAVVVMLFIGLRLYWVSCEHSKELKKHTQCARKLSKAIGIIKRPNSITTNNIESDVENILNETKGIADYIKNLCWVIIPFCLLVSIHYVIVYFPRVLSEKEVSEKQSYYAQLGIDYLGIIVALFAIIVTLLVGWQIFSNIKERERFDKLTEANDEFKKNITEFRDGLDDRIKKLEKCCEDRGTAIFNLANEVNNSLDNAMIVLNTNIADIYKILFSGDDDLGYEFRFLSYRLAALQCADRLKKFHGCNIIVADINAFFDKVKNLTITPRSKQELINDMLEIQHSEQIIDFEKLKTNLENINVDPDAKGL